MMIDYHPYKVFATAAEADKVAAVNNADDDEFTYVVVLDPAGTGKAIIKVYDADHIFLGNL